VETFENWTGNGWKSSDNVSIVGDATGKSIQLPGKATFATWLVAPPIEPGNGILAKFMLSGTRVEFFLGQNEWSSPSYHRFGGAFYTGDRMETTIWEGGDNHLSNQEIDGSLIFNTGQWYGLFIGADQNGDFRFVAWDWEDPEQYVWHDFHGGSDWAKGQWWFDVQVDEGTVLLDDVYFIAFDPFQGITTGATRTSTQITTSPGCKPTVIVSKDTNCRTGPGVPYPSLGSLLTGETAVIVGRHAAGGYWIINNPDEPGTCWLWDEYATVTGATSCLPIIVPPPSPTPEPKYNPHLVCDPPTALIGSGIADINGYGFDPGSAPTFTFEFYRLETNMYQVVFLQRQFPVDANGYVELIRVNCLNPLHDTYTVTAYVNGVEVSSCSVTCVDP
jgi:hypothetical protein